MHKVLAWLEVHKTNLVVAVMGKCCSVEKLELTTTVSPTSISEVEETQEEKDKAANVS